MEYFLYKEHESPQVWYITQIVLTNVKIHNLYFGLVVDTVVAAPWLGKPTTNGKLFGETSLGALSTDWLGKAAASSVKTNNL